MLDSLLSGECVLTERVDVQAHTTLDAMSHVHVAAVQLSAGELNDLRAALCLPPPTAGYHDEQTIIGEWLSAHPLDHLVLIVQVLPPISTLSAWVLRALNSIRTNDAYTRMGLLVIGDGLAPVLPFARLLV